MIGLVLGGVIILLAQVTLILWVVTRRPQKQDELRIVLEQQDALIRDYNDRLAIAYRRPLPPSQAIPDEQAQESPKTPEWYPYVGQAMDRVPDEWIETPPQPKEPRNEKASS